MPNSEVRNIRSPLNVPDLVLSRLFGPFEVKLGEVPFFMLVGLVEGQVPHNAVQSSIGYPKGLSKLLLVWSDVCFVLHVDNGN